MLPSWNGLTGREVILDLLAFIPIDSFEGLSLEMPVWLEFDVFSALSQNL
jgi:hypothetical protein